MGYIFIICYVKEMELNGQSYSYEREIKKGGHREGERWVFFYFLLLWNKLFQNNDNNNKIRRKRKVTLSQHLRKIYKYYVRSQLLVMWPINAITSINRLGNYFIAYPFKNVIHQISLT